MPRGGRSSSSRTPRAGREHEHRGIREADSEVGVALADREGVSWVICGAYGPTSGNPVAMLDNRSYVAQPGNPARAAAKRRRVARGRGFADTVWPPPSGSHATASAVGTVRR